MRSQQFEEAMALRAAGIELVKAHGRFQSAGPVKLMVATSGDLRGCISESVPALA
jgi:hypothetical protein